MRRAIGPLDLVAAAVFVCDRTGRVRQLNRASMELLGDRGDAHDASFFDLLPRGDPRVAAAAERFASGGFPIEVECDVQTLAGARRIAWTLVREERDAGDVVVTGVDVTASRRELELVRAHEERFRMVMRAMPDPVFLKDGEGRWLEVNPKALQVFGLSCVDYRGQTDLELAEVNPLYREALATCRASDEQGERRAGLGQGFARAQRGAPAELGRAAEDLRHVQIANLQWRWNAQGDCRHRP